MTSAFVTLLFVLVGIINLLPLAVAFSPKKTVPLYGIELQGEALAILMRHRAVLLGCVGIGLLAAAGPPQYRGAATLFALASKGAFVGLVLSSQGTTAELRRVAHVDIAAIVVLGLAWAVGR